MKQILPHLPLIICLVGLILWGALKNGKDPWPSQVGERMFWVGLLAYLLKG